MDKSPKGSECEMSTIKIDYSETSNVLIKITKWILHQNVQIQQDTIQKRCATQSCGIF